MDDENTYMIDTPGYSSVKLIVEDEKELAGCIPEFQVTMGQCRFADCMHINEIDCAVKNSVMSGKTGHEPLSDQAIAIERYNNYIKMVEEVKDGRNW